MPTVLRNVAFFIVLVIYYLLHMALTYMLYPHSLPCRMQAFSTCSINI
jgi:hypothetical protein